MTTSNFILYLHLSGALITGLVIIYGLFQITQREIERIRNAAIMLGTVTVFQVFSGSILGLLQSSSVVSYCSRLGLYLGIIIVVEALLIREAKWSFIPKPLLLSFTTNIAVILVTVTLLSF